MKTIFTKNELWQINPADLISYLKSKRWVQKKSPYNSLLIWTQKKAEIEEFEVLVPLETSFIDYPLRISETLNTLEVFEDRSANLIYQNLINSSADVIRIRGQSSKTSNGTLPLNDSYFLLGATRDLITSAACSTILPKANYPTRKPDKVVEFMDKVQFDRTEKGSFIITISTKIPPILKVCEPNDENIIIEEPFERRVMINLLLALEACREASKKALVSNDIYAFETAIEKGVSANLCEAIVGISNSCGGEHLDISMEWSLGRPAPKCTPNKIEFNKDFLPFIGEAARTFKETKPIEEFELKGVVVKLASKDRKKSGEITVFGLVEGQQRKVNIKLEKPIYDNAIKAHQEGIPISCIGELKKQGNIYSLINPKNFTLTENL
jgi:hypothetical protein